MQWPFLGTEALAAGVVNRYQPATRHDALFRNVYVPNGQAVTPVDKAVGAWLRSGRRATAAGLSAAALHGTKWIDAALPLNQASRHRTDDILLHSDTMADGGIWLLRGISVTTPVRTAFDPGRRKGVTTAVMRLDALRQATRCAQAGDPAGRRRRPAACRTPSRCPRNRAASPILALSDAGAESPQETRTLLVLTAVWVRPTHTQIEVYYHGDFVARIEMGYLRWKGVEYDGPQHWTDAGVRDRDLERRARLAILGWRIVHVNAEMLRFRSAVIVGRTVAALADAGADLRRT